jgi:CRISPR-associated protein Cmr2
MVELDSKRSITIAIAWCLAWGSDEESAIEHGVLVQMREAMKAGNPVPSETQPFVNLAETLQAIPEEYFPSTLTQLQQDYPQLWNHPTPIGLVYGGATKIKQYVFEASKLQDIRGASALLDRINLVDLPAFFHGEELERFEQCYQRPDYCQQVREQWLDKPENFPKLSDALIPELIIYSTGGNILAFCPSAYVDILADAIEKRYTYETLTANSCAVGNTFRLLELRFGLLKENIEETHWLDWYQKNQGNSIVEAYFGNEGTAVERFRNRKSFNELATKLAIRFNQRRSGQDSADSQRSTSRRYPPMFETHPYVRRDDTERRSAVRQVPSLPNDPWFSETLARKRIAGQKAKREQQSTVWYKSEDWLNWKPGKFESWVNKFERSLKQNSRYRNHSHYQDLEEAHKEARSLREIGNASKGFVAYLYADGNNMGGYIQNIQTAEEYQSFSQHISQATEQCVYKALEKHLSLHQLHNLDESDHPGRNGKWIHPVEILAIGGDDVMLIVPANKALAIAKAIGEEFENHLNSIRSDDGQYIYRNYKTYNPEEVHRYKSPDSSENPTGQNQCELSMSIGVLITSDNTPIYYAEDLTSQLLKSSKKAAKYLKKDRERERSYCGGTIDFLVMKSVTMLSSKITEFRESGLVIDGKPKLKLYGSPYTLHEIGGLIKTVKALKQAEFPRSQLYQIRSFLEQGKNTAMLNYRYFRVRLKDGKQKPLLDTFEKGWCPPKDPNNNGNLAPWMSLKEDSSTTYETIWRELVDLYPFIEEEEQTEQGQSPAMSTSTNGEEG